MEWCGCSILLIVSWLSRLIVKTCSSPEASFKPSSINRFVLLSQHDTVPILRDAILRLLHTFRPQTQKYDEINSQAGGFWWNFIYAMHLILFSLPSLCNFWRRQVQSGEQRHTTQRCFFVFVRRLAFAAGVFYVRSGEKGILLWFKVDLSHDFLISPFKF